jgi:hypothetical protein
LSLSGDEEGEGRAKEQLCNVGAGMRKAKEGHYSQTLQSNGRDRSLVTSIIHDIKQETIISSIVFYYIHVNR